MCAKVTGPTQLALTPARENGVGKADSESKWKERAATVVEGAEHVDP